jgi:hypothetical protein
MGLKLWTFIKADRFFPNYCPGIKNYKRKISGKSGRGNPLEFTDKEKREIKKALKQMMKDITGTL